MNHTQTSSNQPSSSFTPKLPDQDNFEHSEEEKDNHQNIHQDEDQEEETEDSPIFTKKTKKPIPKIQNQQKKKHQGQTKHNPFPSFDFLQNSGKDHILFKRISKLPKPSTQVRLICYIPEKNLVLVVLLNRSTVKIYNTITFSLIATKITQEVYCMSYCQKLGQIVVGGENEVIQLWNPTTFCVEAECLKRNNRFLIHNITYISESNAFVAILDDQVRFYDRELKCFANIKMHFYSGRWCPRNSEIVSISNRLFLTFRLDGNRKIPIMFNISTGVYHEFSKVYIPIASCVEMTENSPKNVFTCLGMFNGKPARPADEKTAYQLIQFTIDLKMDELAPVRSSNISTHSFRNLRCVKNSKFFLAERLEKTAFQTCLLSIDKNQVEILRVISRRPEMILKQVNMYVMLKDGRSLVEVDSKNQTTVYRSLVYG